MIQLHWVETVIETVNIFLLIGWLVLSTLGLIRLRKQEMEPIVKFLWTFLVILVPILGPLAFFIVAPGNSER